jgi:hypothetical protein
VGEALTPEKASAPRPPEQTSLSGNGFAARAFPRSLRGASRGIPHGFPLAQDAVPQSNPVHNNHNLQKSPNVTKKVKKNLDTLAFMRYNVCYIRYAIAVRGFEFIAV